VKRATATRTRCANGTHFEPLPPELTHAAPAPVLHRGATLPSTPSGNKQSSAGKQEVSTAQPSSVLAVSDAAQPSSVLAVSDAAQPSSVLADSTVAAAAVVSP
jgi:hypothetical protein